MEKDVAGRVVVKSVMFGISDLIFHCKYPFFKMCLHQLSRIFTWAVLGCDANNSRLTSLVPEHKKKSEPFAYRLWVRISTVWCRWWDLAQGGHAKPREISALLRPSVTEAPQNSQAHFGEPRTRGSDSPPGCHSHPRLFKSLLYTGIKNKGSGSRRSLYFWCSE